MVAKTVQRDSVTLSVPNSASPCESVADLNLLPTLPRVFYDRDPRRVARELLGKVLLRTGPDPLRAVRIVETEAYLGSNDSAAPSAAGPTARNQVLFGPPGHAYVYFIYGN